MDPHNESLEDAPEPKLPVQPDRNRSKFALGDIEQICCLLPGHSLEKSLPTLLECAALLRAVHLKVGWENPVPVYFDSSRDFQNRLEPSLTCYKPDYLLGESNKRTALVGFGNTPEPKLQSYSLLLARNGVEVVALMGRASPTQELSVVRALGLREEDILDLGISHGKSGQDLLHALGGEQGIRLLLSEADSAGSRDYRSELLQSLKQALYVLEERSGIVAAFRLPEHERRDRNSTLSDWVRALAQTPAVHASIASFSSEYEQAVAIARDHVTRARELVPGIYALPFSPGNERDPIVQRILDDLIQESGAIVIAFDHEPDSRGTKLSRERAQDFRARLASGEDPEIIVADLEEALWASNSGYRAVLVDLYRHRGRDPEGIIETECELAEYFPDSDGRYAIVKAPKTLALTEIFERAGVDVISHATMWWINPQTLKSTPDRFVFKAEELPKLIPVLHQALSTES